MKKQNGQLEPWEVEDFGPDLNAFESMIQTERQKLKSEDKVQQKQKQEYIYFPLGLTEKINSIKTEFKPSTGNKITNTSKSKSQSQFQAPEIIKMRSTRLLSSSFYPANHTKMEGKSLPFRQIIPYFKLKNRSLKTDLSQTLREKLKKNIQSKRKFQPKKARSLKKVSQKKTQRLKTYNINDHFQVEQDREPEIKNSHSFLKSKLPEERKQKKTSKAASLYIKNQQKQQKNVSFFDEKVQIEDSFKHTKAVLQKSHRIKTCGGVFDMQQKWQLGLQKKANITGKNIQNAKKNRLGEIFYI